MRTWRGRGDGNGSVVRRCKICRSTFMVYPYEPKQFCSTNCHGKYLTQTRTVEKTCRECKTRFRINIRRLGRTPMTGTFCSKKCFGIYRQRKWKDVPQKGRGNRLIDQKWKIAVREKDNYTCQRCGKVQQYIHTHHVATRARRPDLKHDVSNGKCLCNSCHVWVHHHPRESVALGLLSEVTYELAATRKKYGANNKTPDDKVRLRKYERKDK